ncbi:hypothetical protein LTR99_008061 [Exophiala xenobiotica]|uniref:Tyrosine decarboxylase n=1 Tax=Vermiconidia calcicola TaxID=1690605 RepID=A0AAV9PTE0_9PEZI|nr:hypothetical protein LTR92_003674 [Exophiala xenobiotica]KAK5527838.1 hypothetical protein LTR25_010881 [Vermiconidia calcicola]KAK5544322.1 hypothetical protein LTR23_004701 [Chaetothyriales sp. CCFEE 6169]KAK5266064.1 hypothetical protein LTR96_008458 [Exophiala xenobiotica]KAK5297659.1 hypothetical protein LTR99_008061 [Exophiala xenobiotica]
MDRSTSLQHVVSQLQQILSTPDLATSPTLADKASSNSVLTSILPQNTLSLNDLQSQADLSSPLTNSSTSSGSKSESDCIAQLASHLRTSILPSLNLASLSPNYYGFVIGGATPAALLGDFLASIYDQNVHVHLPNETISTTLEAVTLNLLAQLFHLPPIDWSLGGNASSAGGGGGVFTTGATASNILGLALGREYVLRHALSRRGTTPDSTDTDEESGSCGEYGLAELLLRAGASKIQVLSTLPHSSIAKAASVLGIGRRNVISIAHSSSDNPLQIDLERLRAEAQRPDVLNILAVSAGEVNTGRFATDSLETMRQLRAICDEYGLWMHVDGAFGLFARVLPPDPDPDRDPDQSQSAEEFEELRRGVEGLELADSITGDCHKLLNVPYDCGVFFTRHKTLSEDVFGNPGAAYLNKAATVGAEGDGIQSPLNIGLENSRRFRALPVYCTLMAYGREGYVDMLKRQIRLARRVTQWLMRDGRFEVLPSSGGGGGGGGAGQTEILAKTYIVVLFRVRDQEKNRDFVRRVNATGRIYMSGTVWEGKPAARIAVSNWQADVERDGCLIESVLDEVVGRL